MDINLDQCQNRSMALGVLLGDEDDDKVGLKRKLPGSFLSFYFQKL